MNDLDIFDLIGQVEVKRLDEILSNNLELQDLILRNTEYIRIKNLDFFEKKSKVNEAKFELEILEAERTTTLTADESKNEQSRKAALVLDPACQAQRKHTNNLSLELDKMEQEIWTLRHLESNLRMVAELRIIELKKTV